MGLQGQAAGADAAIPTGNLIWNDMRIATAATVYIRRLRWDHGGETSGFRSQNTIFPDDGIAIVVLTNGSAGTSETVTGAIEALLFAPTSDPAEPIALNSVRRLFAQLQQGRPDRSMMTAALNAYFSAQVVDDFASSLKPLGSAVTVTQTRTERRGGLVFRFFKIKGADKTVGAATYFTPEGKLAQFIVYPR